MVTLLIFVANFMAWLGFVLATWSDNLPVSDFVWGCVVFGLLSMIFGGLACRLILLRRGLTFRRPRLFWATSLLFPLIFWFFVFATLELHMPPVTFTNSPEHSETEARSSAARPVEGVMFFQRPWLVHRLWITLFREAFCHGEIRYDMVAGLALSVSLPLMGFASGVHLWPHIRRGAKPRHR
jgi:hypothetical protein